MHFDPIWEKSRGTHDCCGACWNLGRDNYPELPRDDGPRSSSQRCGGNCLNAADGQTAGNGQERAASRAVRSLGENNQPPPGRY